jgi:predicted nucleotidyltransferase
MPTPEQQTLIDAITTVLKNEPLVEAAWLSGSLGKGGGDRWSDVDTLVLASDAATASKALVTALPRIAKPVLVPVLMNVLFGGRVLNVVTEDWQRFDIAIVQGEELNRYDARELTALFNRGERVPPVHPDVPYRTAPAELLKLVQEFLRVVGLGPVALGREEYDVILAGQELLRRMTFELICEENGIAPLKRGGALHRNVLLTAEQRAAFAALPLTAPNRESAIGLNQALAALFLPRARRLAAAIGMEWPVAFEDATRRHLRTAVGVELP